MPSNLFSACSRSTGNGKSRDELIREHKTNPDATGQEAENQREILRARRTAAGNEIKAQQRRI